MVEGNRVVRDPQDGRRGVVMGRLDDRDGAVVAIVHIVVGVQVVMTVALGNAERGGNDPPIPFDRCLR